jgi:hypothetical protein
MRYQTGTRIDADRARYDTSRGGLARAGLVFSESDESPPPLFVWVDGILSKEDALDHPPFQRFNKIPGMDYICYKSTLFRSLNEMRRQYPHLFTVYPKTYLLPREFLDFKREHTSICGRDGVAPSWVVKPRNACCGKGIIIVQSVSNIQDINVESVAQLYIHPFLIARRKFDFRFFVLIASLDPLTIFIYEEGIARFCTELFEIPSKTNRDKKFMHLTNTAINIENSEEPPSEFTKLASEVLREIARRDPRGVNLWEKICEACRSVIIGIFPTILNNLPKKCDQRQPLGSIKRDIFNRKRARGVPLVDLAPIPDASTLDRPKSATDIEPPEPSFPASFSSTMPPFRSDVKIVLAIRKPPVPILVPLAVSASDEEEQAPEPPVADAPPAPPPLKLAKRYFHILGIDIIIDADLNPQVLELNDRPSLGVTVEFEQDLKESIIADAFEHVCANGEVRGDSPESSRWTRIFPLDVPGSPWEYVVARVLNPALPPLDIPKPVATQVVIRRPRIDGKTRKEKKKKGKKGGKARL